MSEGELRAKRQKTDSGICIICTKKSPLSSLTSPRDDQSCKTLYEAAQVRQFMPIIKLAQDDQTKLIDVRYHRECRSEFTHKKALSNFKKQDDASKTDSLNPRKSSRHGFIPEARVYEKICIFCQRQSKYLKGTNTREHLKPAVELRADKKIRNIAMERLDDRILSITSRDIVAAEAQYHKSCYKDYTRRVPDKVPCVVNENTNTFKTVEKAAFDSVCEYIRNDVFYNPRIIALTDLTEKLEYFMKSHGTDASKASRKHLRRDLEAEFGDSLHFLTVARRVFVMPNNLSLDSIATKYIILKEKHDNLLKKQNQELLIIQVGQFLNKEIKSTIKEQHWPPNPQDLNSTYLTFPAYLMQFLNILLGGQHISSDRINRLSWSIAQDIITTVSVGKVLTAKHVLVPWVIKTLTGNVELIKIMNRLGHACSYSTLEEIETALCIEKVEGVDKDSVPLPSNIHSSVPTVLAFDNIDRQEEVLSGAGTSHRVNGIIIQPMSLSCSRPRSVTAINRKDKMRSIESSEKQLPLYITGKRVGPPPVTVADLPQNDDTIKAQKKNHLWVITREQSATNQRISSWTGFNIQIRDKISISPDTVGYLPTINAPATEMATVQEILYQSLKISSSLQLQHIAVVLDQALYAKATEVVWKHPNKFSSIVLMLGNFHIMCNLLSIIGKMFGDAGLRDIAVESGVIAEGSINQVLDGKHYNRAVRFHKLTYEALMRLAWKSFAEWLDCNHNEDYQNLNDTAQVVQNLRKSIGGETLDKTLNDESCKRTLVLFSEYLTILKHERGPLSTFWMTYIEMVEILLGLLRADREGNWLLHLSSVRNMIPWCFALDKINYARYLPVYYAQMTNLKENCPELHAHFLEGGFSVQLSSTNPFGRIAVDQTTEETVNKDTQTAGGTCGFSLKPGTVSRYYLTAEHRATALRQLREQVSPKCQILCHADLGQSRIMRDESDVASLVDLLENNWTNPFFKDPSDLVSLSTGRAVPPEVCDDLLTAHEKGEQAYQHFQSQRLEKGECFHEPLKKIKLKTFSFLNKKSVKGSAGDVILKADRKLFGNMILIAQSRKLDMREVLCYPLGPLPWALANADGTLKKTNKAVLAKQLEAKVSPTEEHPSSSAVLVDAMGLIQKLHGENHTFDELSDYVFTQMLHAGHGSERIDVIFDVYRDQSIKSAERVSRGSTQGISFSQILPAHKIKSWRRLLACTESKNKLTHFLSESWKDPKRRHRLCGKTMYVTAGEKCIKLTYDSYQEVDALWSNQEEADTRLLLHAKHASENHPALVLVTDDTDVFIICLALCKEIDSELYIRRGTKNNVRLVHINRLAAALGSEVCSALLGLHSWTGCDSVSALAGQGKLKALKLITQNQDFKQAFISLGGKWEVSDDTFKTIQHFTCKLYCSTTKAEGVNELRYDIFRVRRGEIESAQLPPCKDSLLQHTMRANYQAAIWRRSLEQSPHVPVPWHGHGWERHESGYLTVSWMTTAPAPEVVVDLISCRCVRVCRPSDCTCILHGIKCSAACKLVTCSNMEEESDGQQQVVGDLFDSDDDEI